MKKGKSFTHATTISKRLLFCFLGSTLIPTVLITTLLCLRFNTTYRETALDQMQISKSLIGDYVSSYFNEIDTITTAPYYHSYFLSREALDPSDPNYLVKVNAFQEEMQNLINLTTYSHSDISDLLIWSDGQYLYQTLYNELWYFSDKCTVENQSWYIHALEGNGKTVFTPTSRQTGKSDSSDKYLDTSSFFITKKITNLKQPDQVNLVILNLTTRPFDNKLKKRPRQSGPILAGGAVPQKRPLSMFQQFLKKLTDSADAALFFDHSGIHLP